MQKRILIVAHDLNLLATRSSLLLKAGYAVSSVSTGDAALDFLQKEKIDLVVVGRNSLSVTKQVDRQLREKYPKLLILKIAELHEQANSFATIMTDSQPAHVIAAVKGMLGDSRATLSPS